MTPRTSPTKPRSPRRQMLCNARDVGFASCLRGRRNEPRLGIEPAQLIRDNPSEATRLFGSMTLARE